MLFGAHVGESGTVSQPPGGDIQSCDIVSQLTHCFMGAAVRLRESPGRSRRRRRCRRIRLHHLVALPQRLAEASAGRLYAADPDKLPIEHAGNVRTIDTNKKPETTLLTFSFILFFPPSSFLLSCRITVLPFSKGCLIADH